MDRRPLNILILNMAVMLHGAFLIGVALGVYLAVVFALAGAGFFGALCVLFALVSFRLIGAVIDINTDGSR